jgi:AGCS family alanine or glycine:cation symporter
MVTIASGFDLKGISHSQYVYIGLTSVKVSNIDMLQKINDFVWGPVMLIFFLGTGLYLMLRMRFLPIRRLGYALRCAMGRDARQKKVAHSKATNHKSSDIQGDVSPFSSLMTELAATIGTGNIA